VRKLLYETGVLITYFTKDRQVRPWLWCGVVSPPCPPPQAKEHLLVCPRCLFNTFRNNHPYMMFVLAIHKLTTYYGTVTRDPFRMETEDNRWLRLIWWASTHDLCKQPNLVATFADMSRICTRPVPTIVSKLIPQSSKFTSANMGTVFTSVWIHHLDRCVSATFQKI